MEPKDIDNPKAEMDFMEQALRDLYKEHSEAFEKYVKIAWYSEKLNPEIYDIALKKASGHKMMIEEYEKRLKKYNHE